MKIAITGHTSGIGQALYNKFTEHGHTVIGFSRSNNFDITDSEKRDQIVQLATDFDVFINNAWAPYSQTDLLNQMIVNSKHQKKIIVNISSLASLLDRNIYNFHDQYISDKKNQNSICNRTITAPYKLKVLNLIVGFVDTPMSKDYNVPKIDPVHLANFLVHTIENHHFFVNQIIIDV
jgi:short-subunit dehydrogenase